ncbi:MAG TPA: gliding motility protein GldN [Cytophagaceae bacterium]|jgi:gliding motility associated protien GldN|nr:gliding motility protein GldN [Cytophagaceae bacterium]
MKKLSVIFLGLTVWSNLGIAQPGTNEAESTGTTTQTGAAGAGTKVSILNGQEDNGGGFNKYSIRPIHESDIMYQKTLIRAIDLREKQNKPMFSQNKWITKLIIEAVKRGDITPYTTDSLEEGGKLTIEEFSQAMSIGGAVPSTMDIQDAIQNKINDGSLDVTTDTTGTFAKTLNELVQASGAGEFTPRDLYQMEIKENIIFDKQRSRMYYDIHAITIKIPADHPDNKKGIEMAVASFSYIDLVNKVFKDNPNAIWYNPQNDAQHKSLADAFELRLFSSYIIKVSNPTDAMLQDIYGDPQRGIMASQWAAFELLEFEHNLWEF